jgi:hypothetical protein
MKAGLADPQAYFRVGRLPSVGLSRDLGGFAKVLEKSVEVFCRQYRGELATIVVIEGYRPVATV